GRPRRQRAARRGGAGRHPEERRGGDRPGSRAADGLAVPGRGRHPLPEPVPGPGLRPRRPRLQRPHAGAARVVAPAPDPARGPAARGLPRRPRGLSRTGSGFLRSPTAEVLEHWNADNGVSVGQGMTETLKLPVLPPADSVLLPGMVVPVRLDEPEIQAAVDAANSVDRKVLVVPRLDGKYPAVGTVAVLEQVGRLPSGDRAAVVRGERRAQIG